MQKVLMVDDDAIFLKTIIEKFSDPRISIFTAKDGEEGLALALKEHPDLILLDLAMPKMDGLTMLGKLRDDEWGKNAQVLLLTNLMDIERVSKALDKGAFEYLVKQDWTSEDIARRVKEKLEIN